MQPATAFKQVQVIQNRRHEQRAIAKHLVLRDAFVVQRDRFTVVSQAERARIAGQSARCAPKTRCGRQALDPSISADRRHQRETAWHLANQRARVAAVTFARASECRFG